MLVTATFGAADLAREVAVKIFRRDDFHRIGQGRRAQAADRDRRDEMELVDHECSPPSVEAPVQRDANCYVIAYQ